MREVQFERMNFWRLDSEKYIDPFRSFKLFFLKHTEYTFFSSGLCRTINKELINKIL